MTAQLEHREYQQRIITKAVEAYLTDYKSILVESPTGSGKSIMGLSICKILEEKLGISINWVAMRRKLLDQAYKENKKVGVKNIKFISMFDKNPPKADFMVTDECLPGDTKVIVLDKMSPYICTMFDIMNGFGTHVLSTDNNGLIFQPILNRTYMGVKELIEVETEDGIILITDNGKIFCNNNFICVSELSIDMLVNKLCCQTYNNEGGTTHGKERTKRIRSDTITETKESSTMRVRMWPEGTVELTWSLLSQVFVQPSYNDGHIQIKPETRTNSTWDIIRRCQSPVYQKQKRAGIGNCQNEDTSFDQKTTRIHKLAISRDTELCSINTKNIKEQRVRERNSGVQYSINKAIIRDRERIIQTKENSNKRISGQIRRSRINRVVDGRRLNSGISNSLILMGRERNYQEMAIGEMEYQQSDKIRQKSNKTVYLSNSTRCVQSTQNNIQTYDPKSMVQIQTLPTIPTNGKIISIRRTGIFVDTFDIGVENTHCFYANGILVHNCQHDSADTCTTLHNTMKAKYSLGLTATPFRTDKIKLSYEKIISDCGVRFLIEQNYLSNFNQWVIPKFDVSTICNQYMADPDRWGKSIIYLKDKKLCLEADQILKSNGIASEVIFGNHSPSRREEIYDQFEEGKIKVLMNVYLLTEGFDCPDLQTVWVKDCGRLCTMQMAGRVLRKDPNNPHKVAHVVQSENTYYPYTKTAKAKMQYVFVDNEWRSVEAGPQVEQVSSRVRTTILVKPVEIPKYVTNGGMGNLVVDKRGNVTIKKSSQKRRESDYFDLD